MGEDAVIWIDYAKPFRLVPHRVTVYLEKNVRVSSAEASTGSTRYEGASWLGKFFTNSRLELPIDRTKSPPAVTPAIYHRGKSIQPGFEQPAPSQTVGPIDQIQFESSGPMVPAIDIPRPERRIRLLNRYSTGFQSSYFEDPNTGESIGMLDSGANFIVEGQTDLDTVSLMADRVVVWSKDDLAALTQQDGPAGTGQYEFYLEGNVIFRQGEQVVYAERMYYNVAEEYGTILGAELITPVPEQRGLVRLKADVLQRVAKDHYQAFGAALTTSRLGVPRYWIQAKQIDYFDKQTNDINPITGEAQIDPLTGQPKINHKRLATASNNLLYFGGVPILYVPRLSADVEDPVFYLNSISFSNDDVFGFQIRTEFDNYEIFGIDNPWEGTDWTTDIDLLSERGLGLGTRFEFEDTFFPYIENPATGFLDAWGIYDNGLDNLGSDRMALVPEENLRGRIWGRHRQMTRFGFQFTGELGVISDRNFLESFYEKDWDTQKDFDTSFELKKLDGNQSFSIFGSTRVNDFFMQTEWIPRLDHYVIGQPLLFDRLTYYSHATIGYAREKPATAPQDPADAAKFDPLPYERDIEGIVASWRQELDFPLEVGPTKVVPYVLGEVGYQTQDINGDDLLRGYAQGGVRSSLMMWSANRNTQSQLFNLNGVAHKVTLFSDIFVAESSQDLERVGIYNSLDDDSQEFFRRRLKFDTYGLPAGTPVPYQVDARNYALRTNFQGNVTSPVWEVADDMTSAKLELRQTWQTKRTGPGSDKIIDWITLNVGGTVFPNADRDNFGETLGLLNYDFDWQVGNRFSVFSNGYWDMFDDGLQTMTIGGALNRTQIGNLYLSYTGTKSPFRTNLLVASLQYRLSQKWFAGLGTAYDFDEIGNLGQSLFFTRFGESTIFTVNLSVNSSRDNIGIGINFEPRFFASGQYSKINGEPLPPIGAHGLE